MINPDQVMKSVRSVFFVIIVLLSMGGLLTLVPLLISGAVAGDLPLLLSAIVFYLVLGIIWWLVVERRRSATLLGVSVLAFPIAGFAGTSAGLLFAL